MEKCNLNCGVILRKCEHSHSWTEFFLGCQRNLCSQCQTLGLRSVQSSCQDLGIQRSIGPLRVAELLSHHPKTCSLDGRKMLLEDIAMRCEGVQHLVFRAGSQIYIHYALWSALSKLLTYCSGLSKMRVTVAPPA